MNYFSTNDSTTSEKIRAEVKIMWEIQAEGENCLRSNIISLFH